MKSYWHYTCFTSDDGNPSFYYGIQMIEDGNEFDFYQFYLNYPEL